MKNKGFTLIELLAVIVVLAIIALIATPIVMNLIKNTQKGAAERSAERYLDAVELAVSQYRLNESEALADGEYTVDADGNLVGPTTLTVEVVGDKPAQGSKVVIANGLVVREGTSLAYANYTVTLNNKGEAEAKEKGKEPSCTIVSGDLNTYGSEVDCKGQHFYVIAQDTVNHNADSTTVSLISKLPLNVGDVVYDDGTEGMQSENLGGSAGTKTYCGYDDGIYYGQVFFDEPCVYDENKEEYVSKDDAYWADDFDEYPAFVYGKDSLIYPYLENYKLKLKELGVNNIKDMTLMSYEQYGNTGCEYVDEVYLPCSDLLSEYNTWLGSALEDTALYTLNSTPNGYSNGGVFVRPVMVIAADEIQ